MSDVLLKDDGKSKHDVSVDMRVSEVTSRKADGLLRNGATHRRENAPSLTQTS